MAGQVPFLSGLEALAVTVLPGLSEIGCEASNEVPPTESGQLDVTEVFRGRPIRKCPAVSSVGPSGNLEGGVAGC